MNRLSANAALGVGLLGVGWIGFGYLGSGVVALGITLLIATAYLVGAFELQRFSHATRQLQSALATLPDRVTTLSDWISTLHPSLRQAVRLRVEGERSALPGPALTPYLVGLLVLLGMLGTFIGMVVTLNGAVMALEGTTDLAAIRAALAAPVKGLGLAFGTSVAGVAASAMLGLASALLRRDRIQAAQALDARIASTLRPFSLAHQREQTLQALQVLPALVGQIGTLVQAMQQRDEALAERLTASQDRFHQQAHGAYAELASSVDRTLHRTLLDSTRAAADAMRPMAEATLAGMAAESAAVQRHLASAVQQQLEGLAARFETSVDGVADTWERALAQHERSSDALAERLHATLDRAGTRLEHGADALLGTVAQSHTALQADLAARDAERLGKWTTELTSLAQSLDARWQQAADHAVEQQQAICHTLEQTAGDIHAQAQAHARTTIAEVSRLIDTAAQAPRAAAEAIDLLRQKLSEGIARDNDQLAERSRIMGKLEGLLGSMDHAATGQREAVEAMVASAALVLERTGSELGDRLGGEATKITESVTHVAASAVEMASVGESFATAVQLFADASRATLDQLQRIEAALDKHGARSDEQLAYYVAQAREIVELSVSSQGRIVEDLQQLAARPAARPELAAEAA